MSRDPYRNTDETRKMDETRKSVGANRIVVMTRMAHPVVGNIRMSRAMRETILCNVCKLWEAIFCFPNKGIYGDVECKKKKDKKKP